MRRFFVKNILFVVAVNVLVKPIWAVFIDRNVQNTVGASYGTYGALLNLSIIFQTILDFGISSYNSRTISQNPDKLADVFPAMLSARLVLIIAYLSVALTWGYALGYRGWELSILFGALLIQSLNTLVSFIRSNIAALHRFKTDGIISITDKLLMIMICGFLLFNPATAKHFRIEWFIGTQIFSYFIAAVAGYIILMRIGKVKLRFSFHTPTVIHIIKQSFPYALLVFLMSIYNRADAVMIERMCPMGNDEAAIWAAAFRLLDMANILGLMFATMLLPMFGRMIANRDDVQPIIKLSVNMMLPFSAMVAAGGIFFSYDIMHLFYHANPLYNKGWADTEFSLVFATLIASFPAWCMMYVYSTLLTANGSMRTLNIIAGCGVVLNLALNFYLIPRLHAVGGAITSFTTQTALSIIFIIVAFRMFRLPFTWRWVLAHLVYIALVVAMSYFMANHFSAINWVLRLAIFSAMGIFLIFILRFVSLKSLRSLKLG